MYLFYVYFSYLLSKIETILVRLYRPITSLLIDIISTPACRYNISRLKKFRLKKIESEAINCAWDRACTQSRLRLLERCTFKRSPFVCLHRILGIPSNNRASTGHEDFDKFIYLTTPSSPLPRLVVHSLSICTPMSFAPREIIKKPRLEHKNEGKLVSRCVIIVAFSSTILIAFSLLTER